MKVNTRKALFEFLSIVVAVVLAMGFTEARQAYLNKKMAMASFKKIVEEVKENLTELRGDSARIARDLETMKTWARQKFNGEKPDPWSVGFNYSFLSNSALEVARVNQSLTFLPNEKVQAISEVYATQDFYAEKASRVFDVLGEIQAMIHKPDSDEFFEVVQRYRFHMGLIFNTVKAYMQESESFLNEYDTD